MDAAAARRDRWRSHQRSSVRRRTWIGRDRELAEALGYTVVDHTTVIATHLSEVVRSNAHNILGRTELSHLFEVFQRTTPKLVEDLVPNLLSNGEVLRVMRNLLKEGVSIRDLRSILEALTEIAPNTKDPEQLTEMTRQRLSRQITAQFTGHDGTLSALVLDAPVEEMFRRCCAKLRRASVALSIQRWRASSAWRWKPPSNVWRKPGVPRACGGADVRRYCAPSPSVRCPSLAVLSFASWSPTSPSTVQTVASAAPRMSPSVLPRVGARPMTYQSFRGPICSKPFSAVRPRWGPIALIEGTRR